MKTIEIDAKINRGRKWKTKVQLELIETQLCFKSDQAEESMARHQIF